ncbi:MAG: hypothetical protein GY765_10585 [bacterium]|nr:hypothetical protein [bacterium]
MSDNQAASPDGKRRIDPTKNKRRDVNLNELFRLLHVPVFNEKMNTQVTAWESGAAGAKLAQSIIGTGRLKKQLFDKRREEVPGLYWFELTCYRDNEWKLMDMQPTPGGVLPGDIVNEAVIVRMTDELIEPDKVISVENESFENLSKAVTLHFSRLSTKSLVGTIEAADGSGLGARPSEGPRKKFVVDSDTEILESSDQPMETPLQGCAPGIQLDGGPLYTITKAGKILAKDERGANEKLKGLDTTNVYRMFNAVRLNNPDLVNDFMVGFLKAYVPRLVKPVGKMPGGRKKGKR